MRVYSSLSKPRTICLILGAFLAECNIRSLKVQSEKCRTQNTGLIFTLCLTVYVNGFEQLRKVAEVAVGSSAVVPWVACV